LLLLTSQHISDYLKQIGLEKLMLLGFRVPLIHLYALHSIIRKSTKEEKHVIKRKNENLIS